MIYYQYTNVSNMQYGYEFDTSSKKEVHQSGYIPLIHNHAGMIGLKSITPPPTHTHTHRPLIHLSIVALGRFGRGKYL